MLFSMRLAPIQFAMQHRTNAFGLTKKKTSIIMQQWSFSFNCYSFKCTASTYWISKREKYPRQQKSCMLLFLEVMKKKPKKKREKKHVKQ